MGIDLIEYGFDESPLGPIVVARSYDGICDVQFLDYNRGQTIHELGARWGVYTPTTQNDTMAHTVERVLFEGYDHHLKLDFRGNDLQKRVWREVMKVPKGETISYEQLAERVGEQHHLQDVKDAVMGNPMAMIIPCHRIINADGTIGTFHWGPELKRKLLDREKK